VQERGAAPALSDGGRHGRGAARRFTIAGLVVIAVVAADQVTKTWAVHRLSQGPIHLFWKLDLMLELNTGTAFGLARGWAPVLLGLAAMVVAALVAAIRRVHSVPLAVGLGLIVGGAIGNVADRLFRGHGGAVVDFIALHFWPTFNVADSCIVVGSILTAVLLWRAAPQPR
jgi:signal peptidase II